MRVTAAGITWPPAMKQDGGCFPRLRWMTWASTDLAAGKMRGSPDYKSSGLTWSETGACKQPLSWRAIGPRPNDERSKWMRADQSQREHRPRQSATVAPLASSDYFEVIVFDFGLFVKVLDIGWATAST